MFYYFEIEKIRYRIGDKVSHYVLDREVVQTKWLLWIATYTLNNSVLKLITIHVIFTWISFANLRQVYLGLSTKIFQFIELQKGVESCEPAQKVCNIYLSNPFLLFDKILVEITCAFIGLSSRLSDKTVDFWSKTRHGSIQVTRTGLPHKYFFKIINRLF